VTFTATDAQFLLGRPEFRRFLYAAIQSAGILSHQAPANGQLGRDLGHFEGRRSLGFDLLQMAHTGQPDAIQSSDPTAMTTLHAALLEALNPPPKEAKNGRRTDTPDRYADLPE
jgi:hypothetical protein